MSNQFIYRRASPGTQPDYLHSPYVSTIKRAPKNSPIHLPHTLTEITGPFFDASVIDAHACDLTQQHAAAPLGERIVVSGRVIDENSRPVPHALVEIWQANSAGRYRHALDQHNAPLDPNFTGAGHMLTDDQGNFRFVTIRPGSYPWRNHYNAWRPAHIHFSVLGPAFATRLVTQMYFPGDPLLPHDPIFNCVPDEAARNRLISQFDWDSTVCDHALGYKFDLVLAGRDSLPWESAHK